jgi:hypothetical protein
MGNQHHAFVIAPVNSSGAPKTKYRSITALYNQWCYEDQPPRAARRFMQLVRQPDNSRVIRHDIKAFQSSPDADPKHPCPFVGLLLKLAFNVDITPEHEWFNTANNMIANVHCFAGGES